MAFYKVKFASELKGRRQGYKPKDPLVYISKEQIKELSKEVKPKEVGGVYVYLEKEKK
jgi:hypothetical protein